MSGLTPGERWHPANGPASAQDAARAQAELLMIRSRHRFYCTACTNKQPCGVRDVWDVAIEATQALIEAAKVVDGDGE